MPKINQKSSKNRCKNEVRKNEAKRAPKWAKREPKWRPKWIKNDQKEPKGTQRGTKMPKMFEKRHAKNYAKNTSIFGAPAGQRTVTPGPTPVDLGGSLLERFNTPTVTYLYNYGNRYVESGILYPFIRYLVSCLCHQISRNTRKRHTLGTPVATSAVADIYIYIY